MFSAFSWAVQLGTDRHQRQKHKADGQNDNVFDDLEP